MLRFGKTLTIWALAASLLSAATPEFAAAAPLSVAGPDVVRAAAPVEQVRLRAPVKRHRHVRRHGRRGYGPAAAIGVFGAIMGAAIAAGNRRDDGYYYEQAPVYAPADPYYEDQPVFAPAPVYRQRRYYQPQPQPYYRQPQVYRQPQIYRPQPAYRPQPQVYRAQPAYRPQPVYRPTPGARMIERAPPAQRFRARPNPN